MRLVYMMMFLLFAFIACEENVNQYAEIETEYNLFMIINTGNPYQAGIITKSYFGNGTDPNFNYVDPFVEDLQVRMWYEDTVKIFEPGLLTINQNTASESNIKVYEHNDCIIETNVAVELEVVLNEERRFRSYLLTPDTLQFIADLTDQILPPPEETHIIANWEGVSRQIIFLPRLKIWYRKTDFIDRYYYVPIAFTDYEGERIPVFSRGSAVTNISIPLTIVQQAMEDISAGDFRKSDYKIMKAFWEIAVFDENLSTYYAINVDAAEDFNVNLNSFRFSNVSGANGLFGAYHITTLPVRIDPDYIYSFGYVAGFPY
ncbi:MAG: hypothetical protein KKA84_11905 [Bacteroidetes bacterium]|nr:hypothetical protein [Bacteroidota bacterium]